MKRVMGLVIENINKIIFCVSVIGILWVLYREDRDYTKAVNHKVIVETAALRKYQQLEKLFSGTQSSLLECNKKYDALLALGQQVNTDCDAIEKSVEVIKKRQDILNGNQKILNKRNAALQNAIATKTQNITIEYIERPKVKK